MGARVDLCFILRLDRDRAMIRTAVPIWLAIPSALISLITASCSHKPDHSVTVESHASSFSLILHIRELVGQCYAPGAIRYNGMLEFSSFPGMNRWMLTQTAQSAVEDVNDLDRMLSAKRVEIGSTVELTVRRDSISKRPSDIQFVAFPCDAPTKAKTWKGKIFIVAVRADLPTFYPPGYREPGADDPHRSDEMMHNITPESGGPAQRH